MSPAASDPSTPATGGGAPTILDVAIVGAGPIGLEAALAAAEQGLDFGLFEAGREVAANIATWGHVRLFSPWDIDVSPRMRRALRAAGYSVPSGQECPMGDELRRRVLLPVALLPQLAGRLHLGQRAVAIGRSGLLKATEIGTAARARAPFRLLLEATSGQGGERVVLARAVLDCTGSMAHPLWLGDGGIPAPGERAAAARIERGLPRLEDEEQRWYGREVLLVGGGHSAQTAAVALAALAERARAAGREPPHVHWVVRGEASITPQSDDPLPARRALELRAARLLAGSDPAVEPLLGTVVDSIASVAEDGGNVAEDGGSDGRLEVVLRRQDGALRTLRVDRIVSLVGSVGDHELYRELQVHECYATSGPIRLAAQLLGEASADCLAQPAAGIDLLSNPEPRFFILGSKSYGRNSAFLMRTGWQQVETVMRALVPLLMPGEQAAAPALASD
jgi:hypothetical protein